MMIGNMDKIAALRRAMLFGELDDAPLRSIAERAVVRHFQKDELLFIAGDKAEGLYVIVSGSVRAFRESLDGREQVIHVERPGGTVGEVPMFDDGNYPSTVAAEEDTDALFLDKRDVRQLCLERPEITLAALRVLAGRLRRCAELVETLSLKEVGQRVARFVLSEAHRNGQQTDQGIVVTLTQTNQQIAARVGSVRDVVSRALSRLQNDGLIIVEDRKLTIPDISALSVFAGQN
ncbi:MAG TPA: Crp/Fnr family transcriptional regulator [Pyrinomonadaceae bacterium]